MYLEFYELNAPPFLLTPDPRFLYLSKAHSRASTFMEYAIINRDGFAVITGEIGSGKTTLISDLLNKMEPDTIIARIYHTHIGEIEFLQSLLLEFGINEFGDTKVTLLNQVNTYLLDAYASNKKVILIIDEAQNLSVKLLEEIRLLTDLETNSEKLMNLILVGQPELNETLELPQMEQLKQRIRFRYHIGPLSKEEMTEYINHRLLVAGAQKQIFDDAVMPSIYTFTGGIPRLINALCDVALICGFAEESEKITKKILQIAVDELEWKEYSKRSRSKDKRPLKTRSNTESRKLNRLESTINNFLKEQNQHVEEMKHILKRLEVKIEAYEDKLLSLNKEVKTLKRIRK